MEKVLRICWTVSLLYISCVVIMMALCSFTPLEIPDALMRVLGVIDLLAIFVLIFSTVKLKMWKKEK